MGDIVERLVKGGKVGNEIWDVGANLMADFVVSAVKVLCDGFGNDYIRKFLEPSQCICLCPLYMSTRSFQLSQPSGVRPE